MDEVKKPDVKEEVKPEEVKTPTIEDLEKQIAELKAQNELLKKDGEKLKAAQSNASSDAAEWKKKYHSTLDEATRKEVERAEAEQAMRDELNALKTEKRISIYTQRLMEVGYDAQTAASMAANLPDGISDEFFLTQKQFLESQKQLAQTQAINNQPKLSVGEPIAAKQSREDDQIWKWMNGI